MSIIKTILHPDGNNDDDLYPVTSADQIQGLTEFIQNQVSKTITKLTVQDHYISGNETITNVQVTYADGTGDIIKIVATNGERGPQGPQGLMGETGPQGPQGLRGATGSRGNGIVSVTTISYTEGTGPNEGFTETSLNVDTDDETIPIKVYAKDGEQGPQGLTGETGPQGPQGVAGTSVIRCDTGTPYISGENTITPLNFVFSDGHTQQPVYVQAKNGVAETVKKYYRHVIRLGSSLGVLSGIITIYTSSNSPFTLESLTSFFTSNYGSWYMPIANNGLDLTGDSSRTYQILTSVRVENGVLTLNGYTYNVFYLSSTTPPIVEMNMGTVDFEVTEISDLVTEV